METNNEHTTNLKDSVFDRISKEKVLPRSRWIFRSREALVWLLWGASILVGAFAVAVILFVADHQQYAIYEATHENLYTFIIEVLPFIWFVVFTTMAFIAVYNLRHTKHGYRYSLWLILTSSLFLSVLTGGILHLAGFGYVIDHELGERVAVYNSQDKIELRMWQAPEQGRLMGHLVEKTKEPSKVIFEDTAGSRWVVNSIDLPERDLALLESKSTVRVLGKIVNKDTNFFHLCGVFPWVTGADENLQEFGKERNMFLENAKAHLLRLEDRLEMVSDYDEYEVHLEDEAVCATIAPIKRMQGRFK